jgi:hypothetical protein
MNVRHISEPKGFQRATAEAALETFARKDGPRRFLVADEVGLGKTVVARTIISEMIKARRRPLVVFYVSSNLNIARQNRPKLLELLPSENEQKEASAAAGLRARARTAEPTPATRSNERSRRFRQPLSVWLSLSADRRRGRAAQRVQPSFVQTLQ